MNEKAEEIQPEYLNYADYYIWPSGNWYIWSDDNQSKRTKETIWLPRQDQLQEMFPKDRIERPFYWFSEGMIDSFGDYGITNEGLYYEGFSTWEQLWLAFVMKEKYNKVWDGEKWI